MSNLPPLAPQTTSFPEVDFINIGNVAPPGKWTLVRADKVYGWEIRKGFALSGATVVPTGDELVEAEFEVELWDANDYPAFKTFRSQYLKKALVGVPGGVTAQALGIGHPELQELGCTNVVVRKLTPLVNDGFGSWRCTVVFLQYRPPILALPKPSSAIPDVLPPTPSANDQLEREAQEAQRVLANEVAGLPPNFNGPPPLAADSPRF